MTATTQKYDPIVYRSGTRQGQTTANTVFSSNLPHRAPLLCYIAGIECPILSASVSYGVWRIPEANISLYPDPELQRFGAEDRVPVVLFYLDEFIDPTNPTWRMLFEGEIVGWRYSNTALGRSIQFDCVMDIAIWQQIFLFYMSTLSGIAQGEARKSQEAGEITQAAPLFPYALFKKGLITEGDTGDITRPFDLAYNVIRALIADKVPAYLRSVPAVNFFTRWVRRQQFHNKWVALPFLDEQHDSRGKKASPQPPGIFPVFRAAQSQQAVHAIHNTAKAMSGAAIYQMLKHVLDTVLMELVMLPTPAAVTTSLDGTILGAPRFLSKTEREKLQAKTDAQATKDAEEYADLFGITSPQSVRVDLPKHIKNVNKPIRLTNYFVKPQMFFGLPPVCNVIFPSVVSQFSYEENYVTQPTRLYFEDDEAINLLTENSRAPDNTFVRTVLAVGYPPEVDYKFQAQMKYQGSSGESGKNLLLYPEEFFKGPVLVRYPAPPWLMYFSETGQGAGQPSGKEVGKSTSKSVKPAVGTSITDREIYVLYAQYEYYRQRYMQRGGTVECAFHPYVVPGFPMMVFDDFQSKLHVIGYLMNVTQQFSSSMVQTHLNFSYGRTLYEFFQDIANEIDNPAIKEREGLATAAAPPEPIPEIRDITQHFHRAEQFYQTLFFMRPDAPTRPAVFQYRDILAIAKSDGSLEDISIEGKNEETLTAQAEAYTAAIKTLNNYLNDKKLQAAITASGEKSRGGKIDTTELRKAIELSTLTLPADADITLAVVTAASENFLSLVGERGGTRHNLNSAVAGDVVPKPGFEGYFDSYDAAMQYCSRPICTLEKYIAFINGVREGVHDDMTYDDGSTVRSARYYTRIRRIPGAPLGLEPASEQQQGLFRAGRIEAVGEDFPQMRAEWDKVLLAYRARAYSTVKVSR